MSTKCTIAYNGDPNNKPHFHFYLECFDEENVYLEMNGEGVQFQCGSQYIQVVIPVDVMETMVTQYLKERKKILKRRKSARRERERLLAKEGGILEIVCKNMASVFKGKIDYASLGQKNDKEGE